jgi:hypothetical protein
MPNDPSADPMRKRPAAIVIAALLVLALVAGTQAGSAAPTPTAPEGFFGIVPQAELTQRDAEYMKAGGIETVRWPLFWEMVQPTRKSAYDWSSFDRTLIVAARAGLRVQPSIGSPPRWVSRKYTTMPIDSARQRSAWTAFLRAAVERYGPGGEFWREHLHEGVNYEPPITTPLPVTTWQIWNESNFFYFSYPVSPLRYAKLVKLSSQAIKRVRPGAKVLLSGLFGEPTAGGKRGMPAATFLSRFYGVPGIKSYFDGVALHPYAVDAETLEELVEEFHEVTVENHDRPSFYITEMGWGSQNNFKHDAFEQGPRGQVRQLRDSYRYLLENQRRLNLKGVYWYAWKDIRESCDFCDSVGLFHAGKRFKPKPAWRAFVAITGGRARP